MTEKVSLPQPNPAQQRWMDLHSGLFLHFGINTFYDVEWSTGDLDPAAYNPAELDTRSWCEAAKAAGMSFVVLTTKHIDGFCNWPSRYNDYNVTATPWKRDLLEELADSARDCGIKLGLYYALWDHSAPMYSDDAAYTDYVCQQMEELLTQYGPVEELWFDGAWMKFCGDEDGGINAKTQEELLQRWKETGAPRWGWETIYRTVKSLQKDCIVLNNSTTEFPGVPLMPVDARCGEKADALNENQLHWQVEGQEVFLPLQTECTLSRKGPEGFFADGSWFWHPWDDSVASDELIQSWYAQQKRLGSNLLLNAGPMSTGRLRPQDEEVLHRIPEILSEV